MSLSSTLSNCLIEGNVVESGFSTTDGTAITSYLYPQLLLTNADCKVLGNNFSAISASGTLLTLNSCSCNVQANTFVRAGTTITAYIATTGSQDNLITDNIFDNNTVDGANITLVTGLTVGSIYQENKNQIAYAFIPMFSGEKIYDPYTVFDSSTNPTSGYSPALALFVNQTNTTSPSVRQFILTTGDIAYAHVNSLYVQSQLIGDTNLHFYGRIFNLNSYLPSGVQILELKQGIFSRPLGSSTFDYTNTQFNLSVASSITDSNSAPGSADAILDAENQITSFGHGTQALSNTQIATLAVSNSTIQNNLQSTTQYLTIDTSTLPQFYTLSYNETINVSIMHQFGNSSFLTSITDLYFSPVRIKFSW